MHHLAVRSSNLNLNSSFDNHELLASICLVFPQRRTGKLKKHFFCLEDFTLFLWHSRTQKHVGRAKQNGPSQWRGKTFLGKSRQSLTSLVFMRLIPGNDWVVRHICIWCINIIKIWVIFTVTYTQLNIRELKHARFWVAYGNRKWAIFSFNLPSVYHIILLSIFSSLEMSSIKNLGDNMVQACEMFSSGCRPRLKMHVLKLSIKFEKTQS